MPLKAEDLAEVFNQILLTNRAMLARMDALLRHLGVPSERQAVPVNGNVPPSRPAYQVDAVASDRDLDSQYGDPEVRSKDPRDWSGDSMRGRHFSECPPEYLDLYAEFLDWMGNQEAEKGDDRVAGFKRKDAARARGWAKRLRGGWKAPAEAAGGSQGGFPSDAEADAFADDDAAF